MDTTKKHGTLRHSPASRNITSINTAFSTTRTIRNNRPPRLTADILSIALGILHYIDNGLDCLSYQKKIYTSCIHRLVRFPVPYPSLAMPQLAHDPSIACCDTLGSPSLKAE